jgi:hypothetical protein
MSSKATSSASDAKPKGVVEPTNPDVLNKTPIQEVVKVDDSKNTKEEATLDKAHDLERDYAKQFPADDLTDPSKVILG